MVKHKFQPIKEYLFIVIVGLFATVTLIGYQTLVTTERQALIIVLLGGLVFLIFSIRFPITLVFAIILYESLLSWRAVEQIQIFGYNRFLFYAVFVGTFGLAIGYRFFFLKRRLKLYWIDVSAFFLIGAYAVASILAVDISAARAGFTYFLATMLSFYTVRLVILRKKDVFATINFLLLFMFLEAVLGCIQMLTNKGVIYISSESGGELFPRATGTLGNGLGWYLTIGYILSFNLWLYNRKTRSSWIYFVVLISVSFGLVASNTRGAWVDCIIATMISLIPILKAKRTKIALIIFMFFFGSLALLSNDMLQSRIVSLWDQITEPGQSTIGFRFYIWQAAFDMFKDYPFSGVGPDNFKPLLSEYIEPEATTFIRVSEKSYNVHHAGLQVLSETGLIGIVPFIIFVLSYFFFSMRLYQRFKLYERGLISALFVFSIMSTLSILYGGYSYGGYTQVGSLYFLLVGLAVALSETIQKNDAGYKA